jgi:hypothetical protein
MYLMTEEFASQYTPGNCAKSCNDTVRSFYTGQAFNNDTMRWPPGVQSFAEWEEKTAKTPTWIEDVKLLYTSSFGNWSNQVGE